MPQPLAHHFEDVTLLITHYNRSRSLERLLKGLKQLQCSFGAIVVSDDASKPEHIQHLKQLQQQLQFKLITTEKNGGLANNINKGQDAVTTPYTLYVQEDFAVQPGFVEHFPKALEFIRKEPTIDYIRFYAYFPYPDRIPYKDGFSELVFKKWKWSYFKYFQYSDHAHLRNSNFLQKFGRYKEGGTGDDSECGMCLSFIKKKGRALFFEDFNKIFDQVNTSSEPSTANFRKEWKTKKQPWILALRWVYLQFKSLKFHIDFFFYK